MIRTRKVPDKPAPPAEATENMWDRSRGRLILLWERAQEVSAAAWFLLLCLPMGLFLVVTVPPMQGQDEPYHFLRAYTISQGVLVDPLSGGRAGAPAPTCVTAYLDYQFFKAERPVPLHLRDALTVPYPCTGQSSFAAFENTAIYSPIPYVPQVAALGITRALHLSVALQFFAGRLATMLAFLAVVYAALRISPRGQTVIFALAALPMSLLLAATYSADAMTISLSLLMVAVVLRCLLDPRATWRWFVLASLAAAGLALSKPTYAVLTPLLLLVPARLFRSNRMAVGVKVGVLAVIAGATLGWYLTTRDVTLTHFLAPWMGTYNPQAQVSYIFHHPAGFAAKLLSSLFGTQVGNYAWQSLIAFLGYFRPAAVGSNFPPVSIVVVGYGILLLAFLRSWPRKLNRTTPALLGAALPLALVAANVLAIFTALFVEATGPGFPTLVPGRYFIPVAAAPLVSFGILELAEPDRRSLLPFLPWTLVMYGWLVFKVHAFFY